MSGAFAFNSQPRADINIAYNLWKLDITLYNPENESRADRRAFIVLREVVEKPCAADLVEPWGFRPNPDAISGEDIVFRVVRGQRQESARKGEPIATVTIKGQTFHVYQRAIIDGSRS